MMQGYVTISELSKKWDLAPRTLQIMCTQGKLPGAIKFGSVWAVPADAVRPADGRVKTGKYINWRKK